MTITYSRLTAALDRRRGLPPHAPRWCAVDCPQCAEQTFTQCGPHPDVLVCADCDEDWPCPPVQLVVEELFARAAELRDRGYDDPADQLADRARYLEGT